MKLVVELGMGDGGYLYELIKHEQGSNTLFIGIEQNTCLYEEAIRRIKSSKALLVKGNFEERIVDFKNGSIDKLVMILPDPKYIDCYYYNDWITLYANIFLKLKKLGMLEIVTEAIDELLQPVSDAAYFTWAKGLLTIFIKMGFGVEEILNGAPDEYTSTCLDRFRQDPERIKLLTLRLFKPLSHGESISTNLT